MARREIFLDYLDEPESSWGKD